MERFFSIKSPDYSEIKECAKIYFAGGDPHSHEETKDAWKKWHIYFETFLTMKDARYGNLLHLPFSGGILDQPNNTMSIYRYIDNLFIEKINDDMEKAVKGMKH